MQWHIVGIVLVMVLIFFGVGMYYCDNDNPKRPYSALATFFVPLLGQLGSRMFTVSSGKGYDHKWLLFPLFYVPPFSLIPAWYVYNDMAAC